MLKNNQIHRDVINERNNMVNQFRLPSANAIKATAIKVATNIPIYSIIKTYPQKIAIGINTRILGGVTNSSEPLPCFLNIVWKTVSAENNATRESEI